MAAKRDVIECTCENLERCDNAYVHRQELDAAWRQLDTSHSREQELQELVDDLRRQVNKLNMDLEQKTRLGLDQGDE